MEVMTWLFQQGQMCISDEHQLIRVVRERKGYTSEGYASLLLHQLHERKWSMAKKIAEANGKTVKKAEFKGFANVELTLEEKAEMRDWVRKEEDVALEISEMVASGYKITFMKSEATGGYQATAFAMSEGSVNAGYILSAFAPSWYDAVAALVYKHAIHCEGVWPVDKARQSDTWG